MSLSFMPSIPSSLSAAPVGVRAALPYTSLPNAFIDYYLDGPNPTYPLVYIVFYRHCTAGGEGVSVQSVARHLNILESDVINALRYWHTKGVIRFTYGDTLDIEFLPVYAPDTRRDETETAAALPHEPEPTDGMSREPETAAVSPREPDIQSMGIPEGPAEQRPEYTPQELEVYRAANEDIRRMFDMTERALGKMLSHSDMSLLFGLYDWLRMPVPLIETLVTYCAENGHRNLRYIEKCAVDWAENGIKTVEDAMHRIKTYNADYHEILRAFGHSGRGPTASEMKYMDKWLSEFGMPLEVITEACDRTVMHIGKPRFSYADKILDGWRGQGLTTLEAVRAHDERVKTDQPKTDQPKTQAPAKPVKPNRFANFKQRQWDYGAIEELERQHLMNGLEKGK